MGSYPNQVYSLFAFIGFLLCCIPLPWHLKAWNTGACFFMAWTGLACLNQFINSVVWNGNVINWAPVWCDISARIIVGAAVAIPAASLCINRRLYHIAKMGSVTVSRAEKRRAVLVDTAISLGIPILGMVLQYIPQGHRFDIYENYGCYPYTYNTLVSIILVFLPIIILGVVSGVYSIHAILAFNKCRMQFKEFLSGSNSLSWGRYIRLICLAAIAPVSTTAFTMYGVYLNCSVVGLSPWTGWADVHYNFSRVGQYPLAEWQNTMTASILDLSRWLVVVCALVFFAFFGFAEEARKNYRSAVMSVMKRVGALADRFGSRVFGPAGSMGRLRIKFSTNRVLPLFIKRDILKKSRSVDSQSDISFYGVNGALNEKDGKGERPVTIVIGYNDLVLHDLGGALADYKAEPSLTSRSSSASSVSFSPHTTYPKPAVTRPESTVEISSVQYLRTWGGGNGRDGPIRPERTLDLSTVPRHSFDGPCSPV